MADRIGIHGDPRVSAVTNASTQSPSMTSPAGCPSTDRQPSDHCADTEPVNDEPNGESHDHCANTEPVDDEPDRDCCDHSTSRQPRDHCADAKPINDEPDGESWDHCAKKRL